jgi:hypothetical protein
MAVPLLMAQDPLTVPATVYDRIWVELIEISAPSPSADATAYVRLRRFGIRDGEVVTDPESFRVEVPDILASSDPDLAAAVSAIMTYIAKIGSERGIIKEQS